MLTYSRKYQNLLFSQDLVDMPASRKKSDILKALANLTRFLDIQNDESYYHEDFVKWMKRKEIKWNQTKQENNYQISKKISLEKILNNISGLEGKYKIFALFVLVSGLRTTEAIQAWNNHDKLCENGILELFWDRGTKKANAVYCHQYLHDMSNFKISTKSVYRNLSSDHLGCELRYLRKINFTTVATKIDPLLAEFMQGRRGNVSQRHYFIPMMNQNKKKWNGIWSKIIKNLSELTNDF